MSSEHPLAFVTAALLLSIISAAVVEPEVSASPEPLQDPMFLLPSPTSEPSVNDPMSPLSLVVVSIGMGGPPKMKLGDEAIVCPAAYPSGLTLECISPYSRAAFYVNGKYMHTEYVKPFYIAGDKGGVVKSWEPHMETGKVSVGCRHGNMVVSSTISFVC